MVLGSADPLGDTAERRPPEGQDSARQDASEGNDHLAPTVPTDSTPSPDHVTGAGWPGQAEAEWTLSFCRPRAAGCGAGLLPAPGLCRPPRGPVLVLVLFQLGDLATGNSGPVPQMLRRLQHLLPMYWPSGPGGIWEQGPSLPGPGGLSLERLQPWQKETGLWARQSLSPDRLASHWSFNFRVSCCPSGKLDSSCLWLWWQLQEAKYTQDPVLWQPWGH